MIFYLNALYDRADAARRGPCARDRRRDQWRAGRRDRADGTLAGTARRVASAAPSARRGSPSTTRRTGSTGCARRRAARSPSAGSPRIGAVGIAALGPAPLLVDAAGAALTRAPLFSLDARAQVQRDRLDPDGGARVADHALPQLQRVVEERPELRTRAAWALDATGFLVSRCIGVPVMDTVTRADHVWPGVEPVAPLPPALDPGADRRAPRRARRRAARARSRACRCSPARTTASSTSPAPASRRPATPGSCSAAR